MKNFYLIYFALLVLPPLHAYLPQGRLVRRSTAFRKSGVQQELYSGLTYGSMVRLRGGSAPKVLLQDIKGRICLNPNNYFNSLFVLLMTVVAAFKGIKAGNNDSSKKQLENKPANVKSLQWRFLSVFWLLRMADWLQGPYFYDVYATKIINGATVSANMISRLF